MDKLLTIVIPSYNVEKFLPEVIPTFLDDTILNQIEILIVNDGSKDLTAQVAASFEKDYPGVIYLINKENGGHGSTINTGIKNAKGKYFKVVDGDDWVDTSAFCRYIEKLKRIDSDLIITPYNWVNADTKEISIRIRFDNKLKEGTVFGLEELVNLDFNMHSLTYKTSILRQIKPISEHCFYVDVEYALYPLKYVQTVSYIDEPIYQYRFGLADQSMSMKNRIKNRKMHLHVISNIINLYKEKNMDEAAHNLVRNRLVSMCDQQFITFFCMDISRRTRKEVCAYVAELKDRVPELCKMIPGKKNALVIRTNGKLFAILSVFGRIKHRVLNWVVTRNG